MSDPVNLDNLREMIGGDKEVEKELFNVFLTSSEECISALKEATGDDADATWREQAHAWKGMALNLGADKLSEICSSGQNHDGLDEAGKKALLDEMLAEYEKVKTFLDTA